MGHCQKWVLRQRVVTHKLLYERDHVRTIGLPSVRPRVDLIHKCRWEIYRVSNPETVSSWELGVRRVLGGNELVESQASTLQAEEEVIPLFIFEQSALKLHTKARYVVFPRTGVIQLRYHHPSRRSDPIFYGGLQEFISDGFLNIANVL